MSDIQVGQYKRLKHDTKFWGDGRAHIARCGDRVYVIAVPPQDGTVDSVTVEWHGMTASVMKCDLA